VEKLCCSFCRKSQDEVIVLLAGPGDLNICDQCISAMMEIVADRNAAWREEQIEKLNRSRPAATDGRSVLARALALAGPDKVLTFDQVNTLIPWDYPSLDLEHLFTALGDAGVRLVENH
jgi:hypothetical protein